VLLCKHSPYPLFALQVRGPLAFFLQLLLPKVQKDQQMAAKQLLFAFGVMKKGLQ
jgi:hypothetical protein